MSSAWVTIYKPAVSQSNQISKATEQTSRRRVGASICPRGLGHLTLLGYGNKPTAHGQRELSLLPETGRPSARCGDADLEHQMSTRKLQDTPSDNISSTSSTSAVFRKVDEKNARRHSGKSLSSTSSTSFSKEGVMWVGVGGRARARSDLSPIRETGRRSRREYTTSTQSGDNLVYHAVFSEVDGGRQ